MSNTLCPQLCTVLWKRHLSPSCYAWNFAQSFSIEVAPYQRLSQLTTAFQSWLEAEWEILQILLNWEMNWVCWSDINHVTVSHGVSCRKHVHPWRSKMNCMQGKEEILFILECTCECDHTWFKQRYDKAYISTSHTYSLIECQDLTGSSYILTNNCMVYIQL